MSATNRLVNGDHAVEGVPLSDIEVDLDVLARGARNVEAAEVLLADSIAFGAFSVVVGVDVCSSVGRGEAGGYVDPAHVVVNAEGDNEVLVSTFEAEDAGSAAAAHGEDLLSVDFGPGATVTEVPDSLFDDLEPVAGVALVDAASDGVHGSFCERLEFGGGEQSKGCAPDLKCLRVRLGVCLVGSHPRSSLLYSSQTKGPPPQHRRRPDSSGTHALASLEECQVAIASSGDDRGGYTQRPLRMY